MVNVCKFKNGEKEFIQEFTSYDEAYQYINDKHGKFVIKEEIKDLSELREGVWIYFYSTKKKMFYPYGIVKSISNTFVLLQTKENQTTDEYSCFRIAKLKDMMKNNDVEFKLYGNFVDLKEFC